MTEHYEHGLVVGKFYPPHNGHHALIDAAAAQCARLTVVVGAHSHESIPLADRVAWLTVTHAHQPNVDVIGETDDYDVDFDSELAWRNHVAVFAAAVTRATLRAGLPPEAAAVDAVFSSEKYGDELARRFGAVHVCVDLDRLGVAVSGTAVRSDVPGHWHLLSPATRASLALRVAVVGAESTGTTTLARDLAAALSDRGSVWAETQWVPEYGRRATELKLAALGAQRARAGEPSPTVADLEWTPGDFLDIAERQNADEDAAATSSPVLVCDTDAFATGIWRERYLGARDPAVEALGDARRHPLYLLTDPAGVAFEQDGLRDGEHIREWMHQRFVDRLTETDRRWVLVTGSPADRLEHALREIDQLLAESWRFAPPLA